MNTVKVTSEQLNSMHGSVGMEFDEHLLGRIKKIGLVRKQYASDWINSDAESEKHKQALEGVNWCNRELEKVLHIIGSVAR